MQRGRYSEMSLANIEKIWADNFANLADPTEEQEEVIKDAIHVDDIRRKSHLL